MLFGVTHKKISVSKPTSRLVNSIFNTTLLTIQNNFCFYDRDNPHPFLLLDASKAVSVNI